MITPSKPVEKPKGKGKGGTIEKDDVSASSSDASARLEVSLPADARLTIDGARTVSTSALRTFVSPELASGKTYTYTLVAEYQSNGKPVSVTRQVKVQAGKVSRVDLNNASTAVASK